MAMEPEDKTLSSPVKTKNCRGQRKSSSLPAETVEYLKAWMMSPEHIAHPYPTEQEKAQIMVDTGIELKQLTNWFVNNRKRYWKPRVEARLQHQAHAAAAAASAHAAAVAAAINASHVTPVSPEAGFKPALNLAAPATGLVHFDIPRTGSQASLVGTDIARILARTNSSQSVHAISETSSSASISETGDVSLETSEDDTTESVVKGDDEAPSAATTSFPRQTSGEHSSQVSPLPSPSKKHIIVSRMEEAIPSTPRKKFRRVSLDTWRDACQEASDVYCDSLPTLEEATQLFGYAN